MADSIGSFAREHHAFYEVSPEYIVFENRPVGRPSKTERVHAGFNVDVYAVRIEDNEPAMPSPNMYALGYAGLQEIAERVSQHASDSCSLRVIPLPLVAIIDGRDNGQVEYLVRIQISHERGLDQPAGPAEQRALEEVENELKSLGITHR